MPSVKFYRGGGGKNCINLTLSGGDVFLDTSKTNERVAEKLLSKTDAIALGNHDLESGGNYLDKLIKKFNLQDKFLSLNTFSNRFKICDGGKIITRGGEKFGVIGVSPFDYEKLAFIHKGNNDIRVQDIEASVSLIKREVERLEKCGVNKIFLLAHTGDKGENHQEYYTRFAKIGGIDVIIGGHDHKEIDRVEISKRGEPVKIVSTGASTEHGFGENLDYFGLLDLEFDDDGVLVIDKCKNTFYKTADFETKIQNADNQADDNVIRTLNKPLKPFKVNQAHREIGNMVADSNLWYANKYTKGQKADFALVNPGTIRDSFDSKDVTEDKIISTLPFTVSKLIKTDLTKRQIIDTLAWGALSTSFDKVSPGVMQVSGMEYTINPDLSISDVHILNEDGSIKYDLDDFNDEDKFICVYDIFLATGAAGLSSLKKEEDCPNIEYFNVSRQEAMFEYLSKADKLKDWTSVRIKMGR